MTDQSSQSIPIPGKHALAFMLAALAMLGPFSVDTYLPAFPDIESSLRADSIEVQQTLTAYMLSFAAMTLWHGALSDAFGRRNIIIGALAVFGVASLGCAASHSIEYLWAFRILQGVSAGAGIVIGRAVIRDLYTDAPAARLLSLVTMIFSIAPALAPIIGGWIVTLFNWRSIFLFLFVYTVLLLWYCYMRLPETLPPAARLPFNPHHLWRSYKQIFLSPLFLLKSATVALNFAGLFIFIAAAPVFVTRHLQLGPSQFGWLFIPSVSGIFLGALTANRLAGRLPIRKQVFLGFIFLIGAALVNTIYHAYSAPTLPWSVLPMFFYTFGMSIVAPGVTLLVLDLFPAIRGTVASCQSFSQTMLAAFVSGVAAPLLSGSVFALAAAQLAFTTLALICWLSGRTYHRMRERRALNAWETIVVE